MFIREIYETFYIYLFRVKIDFTDKFNDDFWKKNKKKEHIKVSVLKIYFLIREYVTPSACFKIYSLITKEELEQIKKPETKLF